MAKREFASFESFTRFLERTPVLQREALEAAAGLTAKVVKRNVRAAFGDSSKLAHLAPATQADRVAKGYTPDDPLLRTGELLRDSIEDDFSPLMGGGAVAGVGSPEEVLKYHEFGYINARTGNAVPPRPVLQTGLKESVPEITAALKGAVNAALGFSAFLPIVELPDKVI